MTDCLSVKAIFANETRAGVSHCEQCEPANSGVCKTCEDGWDPRLSELNGIVCAEPTTTIHPNFTTTTVQCDEYNCPPCEWRCYNNACVRTPDNGSFYFAQTGKWCGALTLPSTTISETNIMPFVILLVVVFVIFLAVVYFLYFANMDDDDDDEEGEASSGSSESINKDNNGSNNVLRSSDDSAFQSSTVTSAESQLYE